VTGGFTRSVRLWTGLQQAAVGVEVVEFLLSLDSDDDVAGTIGASVAENSYLTGDGLEARPMEQLVDSSITCRIAGPQQGRKVFTLQKLPA
jgi:hypothetical protein